MSSLDVVQHMNEFKNILSYATKIGFFFGAGTSCAFGLPGIQELTNQVRGCLTAEQLSWFNDTQKSIIELTEKESVTVEDILNHVREIRALTKDREDYEFRNLNGAQAAELDQEICHAIFNVIRKHTESADVSELQRFFAWYEAANRGFIKEIYTTNYDMLIEIALEANRNQYFDGFMGSYEPFFSPESIEVFPKEDDSTSKWIRLWKLHGSLNWIKKTTLNSAFERIVRTTLIDEPENELMIYPSKDKYSLSRKEPYVAYFDRLKNYLNRGELVFIVSGYSFSDEHINEVLYGALRNNNRLYVIVFCYSDAQVEAMESHAAAHTNLCITGPSQVITNGTKKEWIYNRVKEKDDGVGTYWESGLFKLGDFKNLSNFLIENSGRKSIVEEIVNAK